MLLEIIGPLVIGVATATAIAWCKDWIVKVTEKYWGKNASKMIDWALTVIMFLGLGHLWLDILRNSEYYLNNLKAAASKFGRAIGDAFWTVVEYVVI